MGEPSAFMVKLAVIYRLSKFRACFWDLGSYKVRRDGQFDNVQYCFLIYSSCAIFDKNLKWLNVVYWNYNFIKRVMRNVLVINNFTTCHLTFGLVKITSRFAFGIVITSNFTTVSVPYLGLVWCDLNYLEPLL